MPDGGTLPPGQVDLSLEVHDDRVAIIIADNGNGLPQEERDRLTEPYVTTRAKGTGLGLAIVKKIMEDHGGELVLEDRPAGVRRAGPSGDPQDRNFRAGRGRRRSRAETESLWRMTS